MKIRLASIEGKIADPLYNVEQMEKIINKAIEEDIDLLVFPSNSIRGESIDSLDSNSTYTNEYQTAKKNLNYFLQNIKNPIQIVFEENSFVYYKGEKVLIENRPCFETLEYLADVENYCKHETYGNNRLVIVCQGRGTESVCRNIYSNVKIIAYRGKVLTSNLETDANILNYEISDEDHSKTPYLDGFEDKEKMFENILRLQGIGLYGKMKSMNRFKICLGISGGLDSTVSLLACVEAFKKYNLPLENIIGVTMPGLGTTKRTYNNAMKLMKELGITIEEIDLRPLLKIHLKNISQPEGKFDVTYEQTQSRERTQVLLDIANRDNAIMIGTGCMSEFALGWMTYGGDHLCMYAIDIGLPKTVVKMYAAWFVKRYAEINMNLSLIINDILEGPVSPELLPIDEKGEQHEKTENLIGDYKVQDFFIYQMTKRYVSITELYHLTKGAFPEYTAEQILKWLEIFILRFFTRAYKKNCYGDGLGLFEYSTAPYYFHIPSDIDNTIWKQELEELKEKILSKEDESKEE